MSHLNHSNCITMYRKDGKPILADRTQVKELQEAGYLMSLEQVAAEDGKQQLTDEVKSQQQKAASEGTDKVKNATK